MKIGDLFMQVLADMATFEKDVTEKAAAAGDKAGLTLSQRMGATIKRNGAMIVGGIAALGFGIAAKGVLELERVVADFQAETGATADEAERAGKAINAMAGRNIQPLEEVGRALTKVHTDLGLAGDEAAAITEKFLKFGRATRQDAAAAVEQFDDILDSWGLTAADAAGLMDKLVVSHQKYGGVIADNEKTLAALAPAMKAANFEIDDGIALLNLFGAKGIDAITASAAFAKALTKVKSPQELQDLIKDIAATEDPFLRAEKAAGLFGARAGAKLGNALAGANLDDYKISVEEAAGATEKAADVLDSTLGARFQLLIKQAGAALIGFGSSFGPAVTGMASLAALGGSLGGGRFAKAFLKPLAGLAGMFKSVIVKAVLSAIIPATIAGEAVGVATTQGVSTGLQGSKSRAIMSKATAAIGKVWGSLLGKAFVAGAIAVVVVELAQELERVTKENAAATKALGAKVAQQVTDGTLEGLQASKAALQKGIADLDLAQGLFGGDARNATVEMQRQLAIIDAEIERRLEVSRERAKGEAFGVGAAIPEGIADGIADHSQDAGEAIRGRVFPALAKATEAAAALARKYGGKTAVEYAAGILEKQGEVGKAFAALINQQEVEMKRGQEIAYLIGVLTSKELAQGLHDGRPGVRAQAEATQLAAIERLQELVKNGKPIGKKGMEALREGLKSKNEAIRRQAQKTRDLIEKNVKPRTTPAITGAAERVGRNIGRGIQRGINELAPFTLSISLASDGSGGQRPRARGGQVFAGQSYLVNENTPNSEVWSPSVSGMVRPESAVPASAGVVNEGDTYNLPITVNPPPGMTVPQARRLGQTILDEVASGLREQRARS